jgi:Ca-activated chloride channel family protein
VKEPRGPDERQEPQPDQHAHSEASTAARSSRSRQKGAKAGGAEQHQSEQKPTASAQNEDENAGAATDGQPVPTQPGAAAHGRAESVTPDDGTAHSGAEPSAADLLGDSEPQKSQHQPGGASRDLPMTEAQQAMEHQLNRVPDDPAGLLRQRFLLQHMRRNGQL